MSTTTYVIMARNINNFGLKKVPYLELCIISTETRFCTHQQCHREVLLRNNYNICFHEFYNICFHGVIRKMLILVG